MAYLLDANVCIDYLSGRYPSVRARIRTLSPEACVVSSVVAAELRFGADKSDHSARNHRQIDRLLAEIPCADFDLAAAIAYGRVRAQLERLGTPIGPNDLLIAAHALSLGAVLVTDNVREFGRVEGLTLENWRNS